MKFGTNRGQLDDARKVARARWADLGEVWADSTRREHDAEIVTPLDEHVTQLLRAVDQLMLVFATARRECEFDHR